jgi:hypothetical protein
MAIDISDLNMTVILKELWENTITAAFYILNNITPPKYEEPEKYDRYFDYHCGRPIKTDFSNLKSVETNGYNRDAGNNKFEEVIANIRN